MISSISPPVVLCLSGHDPTGGAGIQADIETVFRLSCHAASVITCLTVQDSVTVYRLSPQAPEDFLEQAETLLADVPVAAIKIGLLGSAAIAEAVGDILEVHAGIPVVLDPILAAGGGTDLASEQLLTVIKTRLLPLSTVLTPNTPEALRLTGLNDPLQAGPALLEMGCTHVLLTGTHEERGEVINRWYSASGMKSWNWPRLPGSYHGSGCTLAAATAALLAREGAMEEALEQAQHYAWHALQAGYPLGRGQYFPGRLLGDTGAKNGFGAE